MLLTYVIMQFFLICGLIFEKLQEVGLPFNISFKNGFVLYIISYINLITDPSLSFLNNKKTNYF